MARIARVVAPGLPHHVTQRRNRRQQTFFCDDDYRTYLGLMAQWCSHCTWAREGTGPQPSQAKTGAKTQSKNQISIVSPVYITLLPTLHNYLTMWRELNRIILSSDLSA